MAVLSLQRFAKNEHIYVQRANLVIPPERNLRAPILSFLPSLENPLKMTSSHFWRRQVFIYFLTCLCAFWRRDTRILDNTRSSDRLKFYETWETLLFEVSGRMSFESTFWHSVITAVEVIEPWQSTNTTLITRDVGKQMMGFLVR